MYLFLAVSRSYVPVSGDLENQGQLPVSGVLYGTVDSVWWIPVIFSWFDVKESVFRSLTQLFCLGDLENLDQLPVLQ